MKKPYQPGIEEMDRIRELVLGRSEAELDTMLEDACFRDRESFSRYKKMVDMIITEKPLYRLFGTNYAELPSEELKRIKAFAFLTVKQNSGPVPPDSYYI